MTKRVLEEATDIITALQKKYEANGKPGLAKTLNFYLKELKFDPKNVIESLDEEIAIIKRETEKIHQIDVSKIQSLMECISFSEEQH